MWLARDEDGRLFAYSCKPYKDKNNYRWVSDSDYSELPMNWFPEVSWEDKEPRELILKPIE